MIKNATVKIEIQGHTDNQGDAAKNLVLSEARAKTVYDFLINEGIAANRLAYKGFGSAQPIIGNETIMALKDPKQIAAAHQKNRRTSYKILP